jgi:ribosome maturation factor RimP
LWGARVLAKIKITERIAEWMTSFGPENGYELSRAEFVKEAEAWYLRVYVDKLTQDGYANMSTEDCEAISRYLSEKLDEADPITQNYYLEVSSPGLDRLLISEKDYKRFQGQVVDVSLYHPLDGKKSLQGKLNGKHDGILTIVDDKGNEKAIPAEQVSKVRLTVIF